MFTNIDYSNIQNIYIKPNSAYNPLTINRLTYLFSLKGKGIIDGCTVSIDMSNQIITVNKGVLLVDNTVIRITENIEFSLNQFEDYESLDSGEYYLIFYYQYDENNPNNFGYLDLILQSEYNDNGYQDDSKYVILKLLQLSN